MPTVLRERPYRVYFHQGETSAEPPHVHVGRDADVCKFWLVPLRLARPGRFSPLELRRIERILRANEAFLLERWHAV